jgi:transcriptional regulator with GAF, ATPase, and Fis domain
MGRFELAHGGTLFLDKIGELPLDAQAKLLRVVQKREIEHIGGTKTIPIDLRIICATNRNLEAEVLEKRFRADLFYRLKVFPIHVPPLRERRDDQAGVCDGCAVSRGQRVWSTTRGDGEGPSRAGACGRSS